MTDKFKKKYKDKLQQALAECETGKQANLIYEVVNVLIDYINYQERTIADVKEYIDEKIKEYDYEHEKEQGQYDYLSFHYGDLSNELEKVKDMLDQLDERPRAEWKFIKSKNYPKPMKISQWYECSNCETISEHQTKFCCYCGAKMKPYKGSDKE